MNAALRFCIASLTFFLIQSTNISGKGNSIPTSSISQISGQLPDRVFVRTNTPASDIGAVIKSETDLDFHANFIEVGEKFDAKGNLHKKFHQYYKQYEVDGAVLILHSRHDNIYAVSGNTFSHIACDLTISLSPEEACLKAKNHLQKVNSFSPEKISSLGIVVLPVDIHGQLCYKINCTSAASDKNSIVFVNAQNGEISSVQSLVRHLDVPAHAFTHYNGWRSVTIDSLSAGNYLLQESGRNIRTMDQQWHQDTLNALPFAYSSDSLVWDEYALDLHFNAEACYDYFLIEFGRHSYDDAGSEIINYYRSSYPLDAYWNGTAFVFGDGFFDQYYSEDPQTALPTYTHEFAHAFLQSALTFSDTGEAAGLGEAISNMFAIAVDFSKNPTTADYRFGDEYMYYTGNDLSNPASSGWPSMYFSGIGNNSSVAGYWFYLLSAGRNGINEAGQSFSVRSIGIDTTMAIVYHAILNYLTPTSNYTDFSNATIQSAIDLFGSCSIQAVQTRNAWYAVGIGTSLDLTAGFISTAHQLCTTGFVRFQNTSVSASSYAWDFGDSYTSTVVSPTHTYANAGTYYVRMIAQASGGCVSADTLKDTVVVIAGGPSASACIPLRTRAYGKGLQSVIFQNSLPVGAVDQCYTSSMCYRNTTLIYGDHYALTITGENMYVKAWIDFNNDGNFDSGELILTGHSNILVLDSVVIPSTAVMNQDIALRIVTDTAQIADACNDLFVGQVADYRIRIVPNTYVPDPAFTASSIYIQPGDSISFTDHSLHCPDHWSWGFSGGVPSTSTQQNPVVHFYLPGVYQITLVASNPNGSATITQTIHVEKSYTYCVDDTSTALSGMFTDLGSPVSNGRDCSFLIAPSCANSITISFTLSDIYCYVGTHIQDYDYLRIYDGDNQNAPLIVNATCDDPISPVTAYSGKALIVLDGYTGDSYFTGHWESNTFPTQPPVAAIIVNDTMPPLFSPVAFTAQSEYGTYGWWWNFGDGENSGEQNPVHSFQLPGDYLVTLITVQCNGGDTVTQVVHVQAAPVSVYSVQSFSENLTCNDSINRNLYLRNTGAGDLTFSLSGNSSVPEWLNVNPASGLIHPGDSLLITMGFSSVGILSGTYADSIYFHTNDPTNPEQKINLNFSTNGSAIPELSVSCLSFNAIMQYTIQHDSVRISNPGCDTLHLLSWQFSNPDFFGTVNSQILLPGESVQFMVQFAPSVFGNLNDTLTLSFQTGNKKICLMGTVISAPIVSAPLHLSDTLDACSGIVNGTFYIHNSGGSPLNFNSVTINYNVGITTRILLLKDSTDFLSSYTNLKAILQVYPGTHTLVELTQFNPANLSSQLINTDVFVVPYNAMPSSYFSAVATILEQFVRQGGVVIFCAARDRFGVNVFSTGLLHGCSSSGYQGMNGVSIVPNHPILQGLQNPYSGYDVMWPMNFSDPDIIHIVKVGVSVNEDLVAFRKIEKGKVIYIGCGYTSILPDYTLILNNSISYGMEHESWLKADTIVANAIAPGDSEAVNYSINVSGLVAGTYTSYFSIFSSDPLHLSTSFPFTLTVSTKPCADFFAIPDSCNGFVRFTDKSLNTPTSWTWDFGDGGTSNVQNPVHQFVNPGTYYVSVVTCNSFDCDTTITPIEVMGPFASSTQCSPDRTGYASDGIYQIVFNTINNYTTNFYYRDYSCSKSTIVNAGGQYCLTADFGTSTGALRAWIDADNDGLFTNSEEVAWNPNCFYEMMESNVIIPFNAITRTPLRLRICKMTSNSYSPTNKPLPCDTLHNNKYQDYTVYVVPDSAYPIASFTYSIIDSCLGIVQFYNHSQNGATYFWDFGNGRTSTDVNPLFDFDSIPNYLYLDYVHLTSTNSFGSNTVQQIISLDHFLPKLSILSAGSTILCPGHTIFLYAPTNIQVPYYNYWLVNDSIPINYNIDHILTDSVGSYSLVYSNSYCSDTTTAILITGISEFAIQASTLETCMGDSIELSGPSNMLIYQWSNGETTQTIYAHSTGTYTLYSTVQPTCFASDSVSVLFHTLPQAVITYFNDTLYASVGAIAYQWYFNGVPINGETLPSFHPTVNGPYSVLVTDTFGCTMLSDTIMYLYAGIQNANQLSMSLYPNPANTSVEVYFANISRSGITFKFIALPGNTVAMKEEAEFPAGANSKKIDVSNLAPGVYVFIAESKAGVFRQRVVIAR